MIYRIHQGRVLFKVFQMHMNAVKIVAMLLLVIGGINWGLVGLFDYNLVTTIFGNWDIVVKVIYILVGLSGLYALTMMPKMAKA